MSITKLACSYFGTSGVVAAGRSFAGFSALAGGSSKGFESTGFASAGASGDGADSGVVGVDGGPGKSKTGAPGTDGIPPDIGGIAGAVVRFVLNQSKKSSASEESSHVA
ncbi:MAG: hypothetical protein ACK5OC_10240, partial [Pirellula sp.]